jgi:tetratricopeptide (TPR) repeat protein
MGLRARPMAWWELASVSRADRITDGASKVVGARRAYAESCISARSLLASGDAAAAIAVLEPVVAEAPSAIDAHRLLGVALLELGNPSRARRPLEIALEGDPVDLVAQVGIAEVEEATEGSAVAFRAWRRAWEVEPGFGLVSTRLREIRRTQLAEGAATVPFTTDGSIDGPIAHTHPSLARARLRAGLYHHAMLDAMEALRHDRSRVDVQLLLAEAWWRSGESEVAHDVAASILEVSPNCVAANLLVAVHRRSVSRDPRQQVERARQADPFDRIAHILFAGRDIPPIMDDAWGGDQWSASRASYGEWPVVAVMPRAVAVIRAQLAAEKAAAEEAERARLEAEAEARRRKAAEEAAKKPAAGAFKGTGVISDTPAKAGGDKADDAGAAPPKPSGFKGIGVIAEEEPGFKTKSRRPAGAPPSAEAPNTPPTTAGPLPSDAPNTAGAPASSGDEPAPSHPPGSPSQPAEASAAPPSVDPIPTSGVSTNGSVQSPNTAVAEQASAGVPAVDRPPSVDAEAPPTSLGTAQRSEKTTFSAPASDLAAPVSAAEAPPATDQTRALTGVPVSVPTGTARAVPGESRAVEASLDHEAKSPLVTANNRKSGSDGDYTDLDVAGLRASADVAFYERRFTEAVHAYAALLRRI